MNILHLTQYYPPEAGAVQVRAEAMARYLTQAGHSVTVLTEMPNHPKGIVFPDYRGRFWLRERFRGVEVIRVWVSASPRKTTMRRLAFYGSYALNSFLKGLLLRREFDVIYANSPPLFVGVAGAALGAVRGVPLVFEVQDLWPESAVDMGELNSALAIRIATWLEELCYKRARSIITVSTGIQNRLLERGLPAQKLTMIQNGSNTDLFTPQPESGLKLRMQWGLRDKFIVLYGGNIGLAQGLETVVESAHLLRHESDIHFAMVGEGPCRDAIKDMLGRYQLPNFTLLPGQPLEQMPAHLSAADVALAPLRDLPVFHGVRPTKILDAWACRRPVIVSARGEPCRLVQDCEGGICTDPENASALADAILDLRDNPAKRLRMGQNGQQEVTEHHSLQAMAGKLERVLQQATQ